MTEQQIEAAARRLCEWRGVEPDEAHWSCGGIGSRGVVLRYAWQGAADEVRARLQMDEAIAHAMNGVT
jgi:hypothetical protein